MGTQLNKGKCLNMDWQKAAEGFLDSSTNYNVICLITRTLIFKI